MVLAAGSYTISAPLNFTVSGVVLRGAGSGTDGTVLTMAGNPFLAFNVSGSGTWVTPATPQPITDNYVPSGAHSVTVADASAFGVGQTILIRRPVTAAWIHLMGMDILKDGSGKAQTWIGAGSIVNTDRVITAINGNTLTFDAPLTDSFDSQYVNGSVVAFASQAHAGPILYSFTNNSSFTLGGTSCGPGVTFTLDADTDNIGTSGDYFFDTPGSQFITNRFGVGILSTGGSVLATMNDPVQFVYDTTSQDAFLIDGATGDIFISAFISTYDGVTNKQALSTGIPLSPFDTSAGEFDLTSIGEVTSFDAVVSAEPSTLILLSTGAAGLLGSLNRRRFV